MMFWGSARLNFRFVGFEFLVMKQREHWYIKFWAQQRNLNIGHLEAISVLIIYKPTEAMEQPRRKLKIVS